MAHTPTPWHVEPSANDFSFSVEGERGLVAIVGCERPEPATALANALTIVRAVNSHEALVKALERATDHAEAIRSALQEWPSTDVHRPLKEVRVTFGHLCETRDHVIGLNDLLTHARDALRLAKGEEG